MYKLVRKTYSYQGKLDLAKELTISCTKKKVPYINVYALLLQKQFITKKVYQKYLKILKKICFYLSTEDDSGVAYQEALTEIERFRQLVKNKYKAYLLEKELKEMAKALAYYQNVAQKKLFFLQRTQYFAEEKEKGRGGR